MCGLNYEQKLLLKEAGDISVIALFSLAKIYLLPKTISNSTDIQNHKAQCLSNISCSMFFYFKMGFHFF